MTAAEEHKKDLKEQALSQPIAKFPDNVDALARFIVDADVELCILTDSIGYALYSNPDGHKRYLEAIEAVVKKGCKVRFVLYSLDTLRASIARQFPQGEDNKQWKKERESQRCKNFFASVGKEVSESYQEFRDLLLTQEQDLMGQVLRTWGIRHKNVEVRVVNRRFAAFCWIIDRADTTMFAFRNEGLDQGGITFRSTNADMQRDFRELFEAEWNLGDPPIYRDRW
jgi:hypothetical protein